MAALLTFSSKILMIFTISVRFQVLERSLEPLASAVNLEDEQAGRDADGVSIFAPSNAAYEEVSKVLSTLDSSTLTQVCFLSLYIYRCLLTSHRVEV